MTPARVIGAGLSGLAAAWVLAEAGHEVEVIEAADGPGGLIGSRQTPYGLVERAANAFVWNDVTARWFERLRLTPLFASPGSRRRFIFGNGRPRRWPLGVRDTAILAGRLAFAGARRQLRPRRDESVAQFGHRIAGAGATRKLIGPALQGIHAAPPEALSAHAIFRHGFPGRRVIAAPAGGMEEFVARLYDQLQDRRVSFTFGRPADRLDPAVRTILCCGVRHAAPLVAAHAPALASALANTETTPVVTATAFFEPHPEDLDGFGVLFPRGCGIAALGCLFNASIFAGRSSLRSETWIYAWPPSAVGALTPPVDADVRRQLDADRAVATRRDARPVAVFATHHSPGLPVYGPAILELGDRLDDRPPWLELLGNYTGRPGVSSLLASAERLTTASRPASA